MICSRTSFICYGLSGIVGWLREATAVTAVNRHRLVSHTCKQVWFCLTCSMHTFCLGLVIVYDARLDLDVFGHCRSSPLPGYIPIPESVCLSGRRPVPPPPPASCQIGRLHSHHPQCPIPPLRLAQYATLATVSVFHNTCLYIFQSSYFGPLSR